MPGARLGMKMRINDEQTWRKDSHCKHSYRGIDRAEFVFRANSLRAIFRRDRRLKLMTKIENLNGGRDRD
jgi:hypothetical protein